MQTTELVETVTVCVQSPGANISKYDIIGDVDAKEAKKNLRISLIIAIILTLLAIPCFACLPFVSLYKFNESDSNEARLYWKRGKVLFIVFFFIGLVYVSCILLPLFAFLMAYASGAVY
jgi:heme/copper-type cytochrome/quinol oxidase subunit 2